MKRPHNEKFGQLAPAQAAPELQLWREADSQWVAATDVPTPYNRTLEAASIPDTKGVCHTIQNMLRQAK